MVKTLGELASTEISTFFKKKITVLKPEETAGKALGELEKTGRYEAVVWAGSKMGLITIRDLLDVEQLEKTKIETLWKPQMVFTADSQVGRVAAEMIRINQRALPVIEKDEPIGIISQVDIIAEMADLTELKKTQIKDIAKIPVISLDVEEKVAQARKLMLERGISHIPVIKSGKMIGLITAMDIVHTFISPMTKTSPIERIGSKKTKFSAPISEVMDKTPFTLQINATAYDVAKGLRDHEKSACILVDNDDGVIGIVTPRELLHLVAEPQKIQELPITIRGLEDEDFFQRELSEEKIRRVIEKNFRMHPDITEVNVRIKKSSPAGQRMRYELTIRVLSPREQWSAKADGWDLLKAFDEMLDDLSEILKRNKEISAKARKSLAREKDE
jgi:predicted transcriptional regulator/ribosome-associated translation inhibitor RaiA